MRTSISTLAAALQAGISRSAVTLIIVITLSGFSKLNAQQNNESTKDGWRTVGKDTVITGVVIKICGTIGKRSDAINGRTANVVTFHCLSAKDAMYVVASQKARQFNIGDTLTLKVGPWRSNFEIKNCRPDKTLLLTSYKE